jgi:hypothetical protein
MEKSKISIFFHLIRQPHHSLRSLGLTPSPRGEGFEFAFLKNQSRFVGEDIIFPKKTINFYHKNGSMTASPTLELMRTSLFNR